MDNYEEVIVKPAKRLLNALEKKEVIDECIKKIEETIDLYKKKYTMSPSFRAGIYQAI